ncbi:AAA family ATPase [Paeniglutamicibacter cryotolerans]|uniref:Putative ATPase n=1 Tax=Paeniglutamicibacter cryotolerans TaxID=670079 RepID=A0A839QKR2_9MICC|nr:AAA family ATPase [Paeniglutamicibacter cryotolerans]MBB2996410.1 putative ATPase [Paeniglutamicibacter cryotolerans]
MAGTLAPVAQLLERGPEPGRATVLVGANGSGKSTRVEAIAQACGLSAEGGSTGAMHATRDTGSGLHRHLCLERNPGTTRYGYFLRAETMHGCFSYLEDNPAGPDLAFQEMSHGESFLETAAGKFRGGGPWILEEPASALSFPGCLALLGVLKDLIGLGDSQVIPCTHSPILAALPGTRGHEVGDRRLRERQRAELDLVQGWRSFLDAPQRFLRHL